MRVFGFLFEPAEIKQGWIEGQLSYRNQRPETLSWKSGFVHLECSKETKFEDCMINRK